MLASLRWLHPDAFAAFIELPMRLQAAALSFGMAITLAPVHDDAEIEQPSPPTRASQVAA